MQTGKAYRYEKVILRPWEWLLREDRGYGKVATVESSLAEGIRQTDLEVQFDACCKRLLAEKVVVAWIMKWCIPEYREFSVEEIAEKYIVGTPSVGIMPLYPGEKKGYRIHNENTEDASLNEGRVTYDVRFRAMIPGSSEAVEMLINIEGQNDFYPGYSLVKRALYYCCRMISSQYGTEFSRGQYGKLKKVYSIWICMNPPKKRRGTITRYRIQEEDVVGKVRENEKNYDLLTAVMVCLGTKRKDTKEELGEKQLLRMLEVLFSDEIQVEEKKWILEKEFKMPMTEELEGGVEEMCNLSKGVWEKGIEQGIEQGIERGLSRGVERGMRETVFSFVKKKMLKGKSLSQIAEELDESEEYLAPFYRLVQENPELSVKELALKA